MNPQRLYVLRPGLPGRGPVLYWMHRDIRPEDNWGLVHARQQALRLGRPLAVVFCMAPAFGHATAAHFDFLLAGLQHAEAKLRARNIPLFALSGDPGAEVALFARSVGAGLVVTDFDPLRIKQGWVADLLAACAAPVHEVDSRNIVPARAASDRREFMARTFRPKIRRLLPEFLDRFPEPAAHPHSWTGPRPGSDIGELRARIRTGDDSGRTAADEAGGEGAQNLLVSFLRDRLPHYMHRNDPNRDVCSGLSAHLHFGMISAQRIALELMDRKITGECVDSFLEELIVRRELSDNFCLHTPGYDTEAGFPEWARETLHRHRSDPRPFLYSPEEFERADTHDPLWNAAQTQMVESGRMHGYMRMYWAKKILEWSPGADDALRTAILLNDRYSLDGRDTNGYTGIAWSIGGVHDRGWTERPIFGKIRYMNLAGARRKFDVDRYVRSWTPRPGRKPTRS